MNPIETSSPENRPACVGGCGSAGLCPGIAIMISLFAGYGLESLTGLTWMVPVTAIIGSIVLIAGWHRYLNPFRYLKSRKQ